MAVYRANIVSIEPSADGTLHADVFVELQVSKDPLEWKMVSGGHFTVVINSDEILGISTSAKTALQKKKDIRDIIKAEALARGVDKADEAYAEWLKLFPLADFPLEVIIKT